MSIVTRLRSRGSPPAAALGSIPALALAAALAAPAALAAVPDQAPRPEVPAAEVLPDWLPLDRIAPGETGYGLTVFEGTDVDTFGVRVLGVQHAVRAAGSLILVELSGHDLDFTAVPRGMSGSPVFLQGRFAGAVAFGWSGALRAIVGLTPAEEILRLPNMPVVPSPDTPQEELGLAPAPPPVTLLAAGAPHALAGLVPGAEGSGAAGASVDLAAAARMLGLPDPSLSPWPSPVELGEALLRQPVPGSRAAEALPFGLAFRPLAPGAPAAAAGDWPQRLAPGSACAVALVTGDAQLGALGTTTWVEGDRVLLMGHPLMQRGPVALPLASARIMGVFPSRDISFKLGEAGPVLGAVHHDLRAGLVGELGREPDLAPVAVRVDRGSDPESYSFAVARDPGLTSGLVFWCLYNSLLVRGDDLSEQTIGYTVVTRWRDGAGRPLEVELSGAVAGPGSMMELAAQWMAPVQVLLANRHAPMRLEGVEARIDARPELLAARVAGLQAATVAEPGQRVPVRVILEPHRRGPRELRLEVELPAHLAPGGYRLVAAAAQDFFALEAERAVGRFQDRSLPALLELVRAPRSATELVVAVLGPADGVTVAGREFGGLPSSVSRLLARGGERVDPLAASYAARAALETGLVLEGSAMQDLRVRPRTRPIPEGERP